MAQATGAMAGKICLVTGATSGIGEVTAHALAAQGATVVVVGRSREKCEGTVGHIVAQTGNARVEYMLADLSSQAQIRRLADEFSSCYQELHVLINNAGAIVRGPAKSVDGIALTFALNHLGYFLLTNLLLDRLTASAPARIVSVSSNAHQGATLDFANLQGATGFAAYGQSKLANLLFTYELARRLEGTGVTANALHPGVVGTNFAATMHPLARLLKPLVNRFMISPTEGAQTTIYLATSREVEGVSGKYFVKQKAVASSPASYDTEAARKLWEISGRLTSLPVGV